MNLIPYIGLPVVYIGRGSYATSNYNGHEQQPGLVTQVWGEHGVNVKVLPDCGPAFDATSAPFYATENDAKAALDAGKTSNACWPAGGSIAGEFAK